MTYPLNRIYLNKNQTEDDDVRSECELLLEDNRLLRAIQIVHAIKTLPREIQEDKIYQILENLYKRRYIAFKDIVYNYILLARSN